MEKKRKILITGSTHGIGRRTAETFLEHHWEVYGCASSREDQTGPDLERLHENFHFRYADISEEKEVRELFEWCGPIDAAFNNAGIGCAPMPIHLMETENAKRVLEVNLFGTALCMKYECASMLQEAGGVIINNASVSAAKAATGADAIYSASKAGILRLSAECAAAGEYRGRIRFFTVIPGWIETRMTAEDDKRAWELMLPSKKIGTPDQAAELVYQIVTNADCFESGQEFYVDGGGRLI